MTVSVKRHIALLSTYLGSQWLRVGLLAVLLVSSIALQLLNPQIIRNFIDGVEAGRPVRELTATALIFIGVAVGTQVLTLGVTYLSQTVAWTATNALRLDLTTHCLKLDMSFHKAHTPGELIERIDGDVSTLASFFSDMALRLVANALLATGVLALLFVEDWRAGLVGVGYAIASVLALRAVRDPQTHQWGASRQAEADLLGFFGERLAGTEAIRANGAEPYTMRQLYAMMQRVTQRWVRAKMTQGFGGSVVGLVTLAAKVAALAVGAWLFADGRGTLGTVYLIFGYVGQMEGPMNDIRYRIDNLRRASASIERVDALLNTKPLVQDAAVPRVALSPGPLAVVFDNVSFQYNDTAGVGNQNRSDPVLTDVSLALSSGLVLGLLGRTGSGKTTLSRLLFRLYDPTRGAIHLDGVDLRDVALSDLRRYVGLVTQDVQLFRASVRENMTLFKPGFDDDQLLEAIRALGLWPWYATLSDGLDTVLQAGGQGLSAGQAQLVALARVFLRDPGLVILDEASSRLDPATERLVERAVHRLLSGRTAIVIAHRLSTVQRADEILILEDGRVTEYGPRLLLATDPDSRFSALMQTGLAEVIV